MDKQLDAIAQIRSFNRFYTNVLGLLDQYILDSCYSLTEVRVLHEINKDKYCTANILGNQLGIDRSYMSRIIKRLEEGELITKVQSEKDNRVNFISTTEKGRQTISMLSKKSDEQIAGLIKTLNQQEVIKVLYAMKIIKNRFSEVISPITIRNFNEADIDYVVSRHRILYEEEYGLSSVFGDYVEIGAHDFISTFDREKECILIPEMNGKPVGSIAIVKSDTGTAQLRYFLLEPETRGRGLGSRLVDMALNFCREKGYKHVFLETISDLETARHIYSSKGFKLTESHENTAWGKTVLSERWDLDL